MTSTIGKEVVEGLPAALTKLDGIEASADVTDAAAVAAAGAVMDGDFSAVGLMKRTGAGAYSVVTDGSTDWNAAYGWGDHASAGYATQSWVTTQLGGYVPDSRTVSAGSGLTGGGALSVNRTLALDIDGLTADGSPDGAADYVATWDAGAGGLKKVLLNDLPGGGSADSVIGTGLYHGTRVAADRGLYVDPFPLKSESGSATFAADTIYYALVYLPSMDANWIGLRIFVTSASASGSCLVGLYGVGSDSGPGTLLAAADAMATDGTGWVDAAPGLAGGTGLAGPGWCWLAVMFDQSCAMRATVTHRLSMPTLGINIYAAHASIQNGKASYTWTGSLPAAAPAITTTTNEYFPGVLFDPPATS